MAFTCIIDEYHKHSRSSFLVHDDTLSVIEATFARTRESITELSGVSAFQGKKSYSDLDPWHFKVLITHALNSLDKTGTSVLVNPGADHLVDSFYTLVSALALCINARTQGVVDTIRITRINEIEVSFVFTLSMISELKKQKSTLQVVVDNS